MENSDNSLGKVDVVISGISGKFPRCDNVNELAEKLYAKENLITELDSKSRKEHGDFVQYMGKISPLNKLDAAFFGINGKSANLLSPGMRMLLEKTHEAIIDSGTNPKMLRGTKTAVYVGLCLLTESLIDYTDFEDNSSSFIGDHSYANIIAYYFDLKGPSCTIDTACSSSSFAFIEAYNSIKNGTCDAAIVGTVSVFTSPIILKQFNDAGILAKDGKCKSLDESGDGFAPSEAVCVMLLQKSDTARRVYAKVVNGSTNNDGYKLEGWPYPAREMQAKLLSQVYGKDKIDPNEISWIETHGTGTIAGDKSEAESLYDAIAQFRDSPLLVGSVKTNLGHSQGPAGVVGMIKAIIAMENGIIPANIHFNNPRQDIEPLSNGKIKVITEPLKWDGGLVGCCAYGIGGVNCHILLKSNEKLKTKNTRESDGIPRLVLLSGCTKEAINTFISSLESTDIDDEQIALINEIHRENIQGHPFRAYALLGEEINTTKHIQVVWVGLLISNKNWFWLFGNEVVVHWEYSETDRPIWYLFSGMGSQWPKMSKNLMRLPVFRESMMKLNNVLKPHGLDLIKIIFEEELWTLYSFISITAIQIALVDVLTELEIKPDGVIGHSFGEIACAYVDGCLTAEQAILCSYYRGKCTVEADNIDGLMASVGLGHNELKDALPEGIEIACHNSSTNCTISGRSDLVRDYVKELGSRDIFAQEVKTEKMAYHSKHIKHFADDYFKCLKNVIPVKKKRSSKWITTAFSESVLESEDAKYCSAEYFTNNLCNPVYFEEGSAQIPTNALMIEIAPQGILHTIARRSLGEDVVCVPLLRRNITDKSQTDDLMVLLSSIGRLYEEGLHPKISTLYPPIEFPVSKGTPMISPLVRWDHSKDWHVKKHDYKCNGIREVKISLKNQRYKYLEGHAIDGKIVFPGTGYLVLVWETFALMNGYDNYVDLSVIFENVKFVRATVIPEGGNFSLTISIQPDSGSFVISESEATCVQGVIKRYESDGQTDLPLNNECDSWDLKMDDFYKELSLCGLQYKGDFKGIMGGNLKGKLAKIKWNDNYVTFLDNLLQSIAMTVIKVRKLALPVSLRKVVIDVNKQKDCLEKSSDNSLYSVLNLEKNTIQSGGIQMDGLKVAFMDRRSPYTIEPVLRKYQFIPFVNEISSMEDAIDVVYNIVVECLKLTTLTSTTFTSIEIINEQNEKDEIVSNALLTCIKEWIGVEPELTIFTKIGSYDFIKVDESISVQQGTIKSNLNSHLVVVHGIFNNNQMTNLKNIIRSLKEGSYLLCIENGDAILNLDGIDVVCDMKCTCSGKKWFLLRKIVKEKINEKLIAMKIELYDYKWVTKLQDIVSDLKVTQNQKIVIYSENHPSGILGLYKCLKREIPVNNWSCFLIDSKDAPPFSIDDPFYKIQLEKNYPLNVYRNSSWGTYCHLQLRIPETISTEHAYIDVLKRGDLSSVKWIEGPVDPYRNIVEKETKKNDIFYVHYCSLNFRDIMLATGRLLKIVEANHGSEGFIDMGFEFAGMDSNGKRYMVMTRGSTFYTQTRMKDLIEKDDVMYEVPEKWSLEDAATVPVVYVTVVYAFSQIKVNLKRGESILIHSGAGGVGQAAINIALHYGCEIFTTVGSDEKREFIKKHFPQIPECNIGNSRDTSFEDMIHERTNGRGVDVVLNSLSEDKLLASVRCVALNGRFVELGRYDIMMNNSLGMEVFLKGIAFHAVGEEFYDECKRDEIRKAMEDGMREGYIKPIVRKVFQKHQVEDAFKYMASWKHIGKILINLRDEKNAHVRTYIDAIPRYLCFAEKSYIVCGGLGGFGLELVQWLISRGAKKIVVSSRSGIQNDYQRFHAEKWKWNGADVIISTDDITTGEGAKCLIEKANQLGTVSAIFHLAAILNDAMFDFQNEETFSSVVAAKITASSHLDKLSRKMCPSLENFVIFSSIVSGFGTIGQSNYGWANSCAERLCEERKSLGFPFLAIQWGSIGDVGMVARMSDENKEVYNLRLITSQSIQSCFETLNKLLCQSETVVSSWIPAEKKISENKKGDITVIQQILELLGIKDIKNVSMKATLAEAGLDSFSAAEIKRVMEIDYDTTLSVSQIKNLTFERILKLSSINPIDLNVDGSMGKIVQPILINAMVPALPDEELLSQSFVKIKGSKGSGTDNVFYVPGSLVTAQLAEKMLRMLEKDVICIQYHNKNYIEYEQMCNYALRIVKNHLKIGKPFTIISHSYGSAVAMEMVRKLEEEGISGNLCLIEGSPKYVEFAGRDFFTNFSGDITEVIRLRIIELFLADVDLIEEYRAKSKDIESWNEKLDFAFSMLPADRKIHGKEYLSTLVEIFSAKLRSLKENMTGFNTILKANTIFFRVRDQIMDLEYDYGLQQYFSKPIEIHLIESNHYSILQNEDVAKIIKQRFLD